MDHIELFTRVKSIIGKKIHEIAKNEDLYQKGSVGNIIESALGIRNNHQGPDLPELQIEVKTLPVKNMQAVGSTFVSSAKQDEFSLDWHSSFVRSKLQTVLFILVSDGKLIDQPNKKILNAGLWHLESEQEQILQQDWSELMEQSMQEGFISAEYGTYLQLRPKALNTRNASRKLNMHGHMVNSNNLGFYLRRDFVNSLIQSNKITWL